MTRYRRLHCKPAMMVSNPKERKYTAVSNNMSQQLKAVSTEHESVALNMSLQH